MRSISVQIDETTSEWRCKVTPPSDGLQLEPSIEALFRREVLDQNLRLAIEAETEPLRTAILGLAFSRTGLQGE